MNKAHIAGTNALAPSAPMLLLETFKMDIAPLALFTLVVQDFEILHKIRQNLGKITFN